MNSKKLRNLFRSNSVILCESEEGTIVSGGFKSSQVLSSTRDSRSSHNITIDMPQASTTHLSTNTSICIPAINIAISRVWHKKTRVGKGTSKPTYQTKGWRFELVPCKFKLKSVSKLSVTYDILKTIQIQIPNPIALNNDIPLNGWTDYHKRHSYWAFGFPSPTLLGIF